MKRMSSFLSVLLAVLTVFMLLGSVPGIVHAEETLAAPDVTISNVASTGKIRVTWGAVEGAAEYQVYRAATKSGKYSLVLTTTDTQYTNTAASAGKTSYYYVRAVGADGTYADSRIVGRACDLARPVVTASNDAATGNIKLSWKSIRGAVEYQVYRSVKKSSGYTRIAVTTENSYQDTTAQAEKTYYYKVRAIHSVSAANSAYSAVKARMGDLPRPVITLNNRTSDGKIRVKWEAVEGAVKYQVYRATSKNGTYSLKYTTTGTSYINTGATAGNTYYYKVKAIAGNSSANSAFSTYKYRVCDLAQPEVTTSLTSEGEPLLSWDALSGAVKYQVYRATSKNGTYSRVTTTAETGYTDSNAEIGNTYYYKVRAIHSVSAANSSYSEAVSETAAVVQSGYYYVNTNGVTLYTSASSSAASFRIPYMAEVQCEENLPAAANKWCKVYYQGSPYYVWINNGSDKFTARQSGLSYTGSTPYQQEVLDLAMTIYKEWDTDYISGESGDKHSDGRVGFDCSGLASYVINTVMEKHIPAWRLTANLEKLYAVDNIVNEDLPGEVNAEKIALADIQPGDVLFFNTDGVLGHCGIYLGNGEFIHSTSTWDGVVIAPLAGSYTERFVGARRYLPAQVEPANTTMYLTSGCKLYENRSGEGNYLMRLSKGTAVTVLYTKSDFTAYVRTADGTCGFVWAKYLSK